jgi:DNA excision repair protein ERCC-1
VTVPRNINKADAVALVGSFGSLRNAVNAAPEQVAVVGGWGERKVRAWCRAVEEPFRVGKRGKGKGASRPGGLKVGGKVGEVGEEEEDAEALVAAAEAEVGGASGDRESEPVPSRPAPAADAARANPAGRRDEALSDGVAAALARLRDKG